MAAMTEQSLRRSLPSGLSNRQSLHQLSSRTFTRYSIVRSAALLCSGQVLGQLGRLSLLWERPQPTPPTRALLRHNVTRSKHRSLSSSPCKRHSYHACESTAMLYLFCHNGCLFCGTLCDVSAFLTLFYRF